MEGGEDGTEHAFFEGKTHRLLGAELAMGLSGNFLSTYSTIASESGSRRLLSDGTLMTGTLPLQLSTSHCGL